MVFALWWIALLPALVILTVIVRWKSERKVDGAEEDEEDGEIELLWERLLRHLLRRFDCG